MAQCLLGHLDGVICSCPLSSEPDDKNHSNASKDCHEDGRCHKWPSGNGLGLGNQCRRRWNGKAPSLLQAGSHMEESSHASMDVMIRVTVKQPSAFNRSKKFKMKMSPSVSVTISKVLVVPGIISMESTREPCQRRVDPCQ